MKKCPKCDKDHSKEGKFCSRTCANSRVKTQELKNNLSIKMKDYRFGAVGIKGRKKDWIIKNCVICNKQFEKTLSLSKTNYCSKECHDKDENYLGRKKAGGLRQGSGRGKCGWYKGYWCDSSYELAWVIYNLEHNIKFERNKKGYEYEFRGKKFKYYPDFICNGEIIEIKGYKTEQVNEKLKVVENIKVLFEKDLEKEFTYVKEKYGKDFIKLYE